jgi:hypothetical protein
MIDDGDTFGVEAPRPRGQKVHRVAPPGSLVATA